MLITFEIAVNIVAASINYTWNSSFLLLSICVGSGIIKTIELAKAVELVKAIKVAI
tara:strand:+ start:262 stop:429 length:168 start_codon:yes stop_codon:yes gene_type:complete